MSRTYNTRPYWVKLNDPKFPTKERHDHVIVRREPTGRTIVESVERWTYIDGWPKLVTDQIERTEYATWSEVVECDIDKPERPWREKRKLWGTPEEKRCDKRALISEPCACCRRYAKKLYTSATRASINQQLHNAVRDFGWTTDPDEWYAVDINTASLAEDWDFWD